MGSALVVLALAVAVSAQAPWAPSRTPDGHPDLHGPTCGGVAYEVVKKVVKAGDIIIVPAGVVHGWLDIPEHVDYLSFRPSPGILTTGWVHPVLKK